MNQRLLAILSIVILAIVVIGAVVFVRLHPAQDLKSASTAATPSSLQVGSKAPQFQIPTTAGPFDLNAQTKPVFLEVFATWCPHCQRETVVLNQLYLKYHDRVAFIAIPGSNLAMDEQTPESLSDVELFQQQFSVKYPIAVYDPALTVANQYYAGGFPTLAIIGRDKKIAYYDTGEVPFAKLSATLASAIR